MLKLWITQIFSYIILFSSIVPAMKNKLFLCTNSAFLLQNVALACMDRIAQRSVTVLMVVVVTMCLAPVIVILMDQLWCIVSVIVQWRMEFINKLNFLYIRSTSQKGQIILKCTSLDKMQALDGMMSQLALHLSH